MSVRLFECLFVCLSGVVFMSTISVSICLLSVRLFVYVFLSACLSVCMSLSLLLSNI